MTSVLEDVIEDGFRCSIYRDAPNWGDLRTASVGKFKCTSSEVAIHALQRICAQLTSEGFQAVIGPMDGSTWHSYRAVVETDASKPFLMEPTSGAHDVSVFTQAGFTAVENYVSMRVNTKDAIGAEPVSHNSATLENWDGDSADSFFGEVYDFSRAGFARNAFYKPISREAFLDLYRPYLAFLNRDFIYFARRNDGSLAGFLFGIPNYAEGPETKTIILKTYASAERGVGHFMADRFHRTALDKGFDTTIHALIHDSNISLKRSTQHNANVFRRYALFGRML
jgi:hypothetical protein